MTQCINVRAATRLYQPELVTNELRTLDHLPVSLFG